MRKRKFGVLFLAGLLITAWVLHAVGFEDVVRQVLKLDARYFLLFLAIQLAMLFLWALKWWVILRHHKIPFSRILPVTFFGYLMNNLTPMSTAGGEPFRAYLLSKTEKISTEDSAASVVIDLFLELFPLIIMIAIAIFITLTYDVQYLLAGLLAVSGLVTIILLFFLVMLIINDKVSSVLVVHTIRFMELIPVPYLRNHAKDAKMRIDKIMHNFKKTMRTAIKDNKTVYICLLLASLIWALAILRMYLILHMLGLEIPLSTLIVARVGVVVLTFLSIIPGGLGIWEGGSTWLFNTFGIPAPIAMAATLIDRLFSFWIGSLIGLAATFYIGAAQILKKYFQD